LGAFMGEPLGQSQPMPAVNIDPIKQTDAPP
jgi:hypothetical protein